MAAAPAAIPFRINLEDKGANTVTEEINLALKSAARTITRTKLTDKIRSEVVLERAGLRNLNELVASASATMVWKSKMNMDPLGTLLFPDKAPNRPGMRSENKNLAKLPVPGYGLLAANLLSRVWNESPDLQKAKSLGSAKVAAKKWSESLQYC